MWREAIREVLGLPSGARIVSVYEYSVPKGNKTYVYLRCEYIIAEKKKTRHIPRRIEGRVRTILASKEREDALEILDNIYYQAQQLKRLSLDDELREQLKDLAHELIIIAEERNGKV